MTLRRVDRVPPPSRPSARVLRLLEDADRRLDALLEDGLRARLPNFAPSDHRLVHDWLADLAAGELRGERFLEWGSALGVVAGMAADLGLRASGIEIEPRFVEASRDLLGSHGLAVEIAQGSFVPEGHDVPPELDDPESHTLLSGCCGYQALERDLDEFRLVFAYPWPGMGGVLFDLFERHAAPGALLLTYHGLDGCQLRRKW